MTLEEKSMSSQFSEMLVAAGGLKVVGQLSLPAGGITDAMVANFAGIGGDKQQHVYRKTHGQSGTVASVTIPIHGVFGVTGLLKALKAGLITPCAGAATVTIDLKKNGSSVLSSPITLNSASAARTLYAATISNTALAAGDFLELVVTATAGGGTVGQGLLVDLLSYEDSA